MPLILRPETKTEFDVLTLGECMIRLSPPGHQRIELTPVFEAFAGGGESDLRRNLMISAAVFGLIALVYVLWGRLESRGGRPR